MRRCLMWLMICLLPLRLWAGDAMAVQHTPPASHHLAHDAVEPVAPDAHPCHGIDAQTNSDAQAHSKVYAGAGVIDTSTDHGGACGDCSVCHGPLAAVALPRWSAPSLSAAVPVTVGWSVLSGSDPPQLKPPRA